MSRTTSPNRVTTMTAPTRLPAQQQPLSTSESSTLAGGGGGGGGGEGAAAAAAATATTKTAPSEGGSSSSSIPASSQQQVNIGSKTDKNVSSNNNNNKNNSSSSSKSVHEFSARNFVSLPTAQKQSPQQQQQQRESQAKSGNDFITNFFNNLKSTKQQQQQQHKSQQHQQQVAETIALSADYKTNTSSSSSSSSPTTETHDVVGDKQKTAKSENVACDSVAATPVVIKTEKDITCADKQQQQQQQPQQAKKAAVKSSTMSTPPLLPNIAEQSKENVAATAKEAAVTTADETLIKTEIDSANIDNKQQQKQQQQQKKQQPPQQQQQQPQQQKHTSPTSSSLTIPSTSSSSSSSSSSSIRSSATNEKESVKPDNNNNNNNNSNKYASAAAAPAAAAADDDDEDDGDSKNLILAKPRPVLLSAVNPHIICNLCHGYLIDATTIVECLHSFCHSCIMKHLRTEQYCPRCEMMINTAKPNIKSDTTLQAIVYKLVPGLYEKELMRKRAFYKNKPEEAALATPEQRGDDTEHLIFSPSEYMSLSLEYANIEEYNGNNAENEIVELLKPKFLQCPSICTVAHLKKFVLGKFNIDTNRYNVDIMYKVKTIVLLDHYTLMDVAYIYTWKRDAPMRFYFCVKESSKRLRLKVRKSNPIVVETKQEVVSDGENLNGAGVTLTQQPTKSSLHPQPEAVTAIKEERNDSESVAASTALGEEKTFEIIPQSNHSTNVAANEGHHNTDNLKITIVSKGSREKQAHNGTAKPPEHQKPSKEKKEIREVEPKDERKVENIKLKIDLSKQNSVTIINMSDPERKEIVKPVRPDREWKVKCKRDKGDSPLSSPNSDRERKKRTPSPLTVPPLTIKAERISPLAKSSPSPQLPESKENSNPAQRNSEDEEKSQFLKSFALTPIKDVKVEASVNNTAPPKISPLNTLPKSIGPLQNSLPSFIKAPAMLAKPVSSKRKSKEPLKAVPKKSKYTPVPLDDFKIKLPPSSHLPHKSPLSLPPSTAPNKDMSAGKTLMPPPPPLSVMRPPSALPKKSAKFAPPGSLTPHPSHVFQPAAPGNRTPIAKRYQPILPKAARPNPFANIPTDVSNITTDSVTAAKSISSADTTPAKVGYGPKTPSKTIMGPPSAPTASSSLSSANLNRGMPSVNSSKANVSSNYLNMALYNSSRCKGNEAPPGCRTPMYSPGSPIYTPGSPHYSPNYNIPTMPTYKYGPKPASSNASYFHSMLGANTHMSSLFPSPPTKKTPAENPPVSCASSPPKTVAEQPPKRAYPFAKSPSPVEDLPEKQLKVKSLLTSCNINIPSSLSITITREDAESQSNNNSHPKHKSPVNNYIEILKLPDHSMESGETSKRSSPPKQIAGSQQKKENANSSPQPQVPQNPLRQASNAPAEDSSKATPSTQLKSLNMNFSQPSGAINNVSSSSTPSKSPPAANPSTVKTTTSKTNATPLSTASNLKPHMPPPTAQVDSLRMPKTNEVAVSAEKKTSSPEKRPLSTNSSDNLSSPSSNQAESKAPKSPNSDSSSAQAAKKFRHILPRQNPVPISEVVPPKVTAGNIIGTYSSPTGVAVKVHANKKIPPSKKSPNFSPTPLNGATSHSHSHNKASTPKTSPNHTNPTVPSTTKPLPVTSTAPLKTCNANKNKKMSPLVTPSSATNGLNKQPPTSHPHTPMNPLAGLPTHTMPNISHPVLPNISAHIGMPPPNAPNQTELSQFLKDNLLRAQVQAAAANQSNMFYTYANAAAQMSQFAPSMYNYQQAYIMEQLTRMQRAGNDAFVEYMQKLKSGSLNKPPAVPDAPESCQNPPSTSSPSSKALPPTPNANNNHKPAKVQAKAKAK